MRYAYVNAFVESAEAVLLSLAGPPVTRGRPTLVTEPRIERGLAVLVAVAGEVDGHVIFDVDPDTGRRLVDRLTGGDDPGDEEFLQDTMAEMTNMLVGRAVSVLHDAGHRFTLSAPMVFTGGPLAFARSGAGRAAPGSPAGGGAVRRPDVPETLVLTLDTALGRVILYVGISDA